MTGTCLVPRCGAKATIVLPLGLAHTAAPASWASRGTLAESLCFCFCSLETPGCSITKHIPVAISPSPRWWWCWARNSVCLSSLQSAAVGQEKWSRTRPWWVPCEPGCDSGLHRVQLASGFFLTCNYNCLKFPVVYRKLSFSWWYRYKVNSKLQFKSANEREWICY